MARQNSTLVILLILMVLTGCSSTVKFEIDQLEHIETFPKAKNHEWKNRDMRFHNNYAENVSSINSIYFPEDTSKSWINVEHLVQTTQYDVDLLASIDDNHYLFSAVEFHSDLSIKEVTVEHHIGDTKLQKVGSYIYKYPRKSDGSIDPNKKFLVIPVSSGPIIETEQFVYVTIYKMPISRMKSIILPKKWWFMKPGNERITIKYLENGEIREKTFEFEIAWTKRINWVT